MLGQEQVVVVEQHHIAAARMVETQVGGAAVAEGPILADQLQRELSRHLRQGSVAAAGVHDDGFEGRIGLRRQGPQSFGQLGAIDAADDDTD
jgi:hypothetical protein